MSDLSFRYSDSLPWIFESLSFSATAGQMLCLRGPSGCGKSTVLDLIGGLRRPVSGRIDWEGSTDFGGLHPSWVIQSNPVLAGRTAVDNAAVSLLAQGWSMTDARVAAHEVLDELGLGARSRALVAELSGGEVQRVSIARALLAASQVILADEPTGQLDASGTSSVYVALRAAAIASKLVVVATHDEWLADHCDVLIELRLGGDYGFVDAS